MATQKHQMPHEPTERTVETQNPIVQDRAKAAALSSVQTPSGRKNRSCGSDLTETASSSGSYNTESVTVRPGSGNVAPLASRLSAIVREPPPKKTVGGKGIAPPITPFPHSKRAKDNPISYTRVSRLIHIEVCRSHLCAQPPAVPGKRFILFDDDDDDDDDDDI